MSTETVTTDAITSSPHLTPATTNEFTRPLYVRKVPESVWLRVHDNAHRSRMRIQDYVVQLLRNCQPFIP